MLAVGVCYYPEQWDRSMWEADARLMRRAGIRVARLAEFAWCRMEPRESEYDFAWLDDAVGVLHAEGIRVVLGTPTNTPPRWLTDKCPDVLPVDQNGARTKPGVRRHRCYNSPSMRKYGSAIVEQMARRYANHPAVIGWQTDNEFMPDLCTCDHCAERFRQWLRRRYETLDALNRAWGTVVWGGEYSDWGQLRPPTGGSKQLNPSYLLDCHRFDSASIVDFQQSQVEILRRLCPRHFITHNSWSVPTPTDYASLFEPLDFASLDYYPSTSPGDAATQPYGGALQLDLTRGFKRRNFWVMEQLSGPPGAWMPMWRTPPPGLIRAFGWQSIARGADVVVFFRFRSAAVGAEQFWHGMIDHSNVPGRRFDEAARFCEEVNRLADALDGSVVRNEVALFYSYEQHTALKIQPQVEGMDYYDNLKTLHRTLTRLGVGVDVVDWRADLDGYKLVVAPHLYLLDEGTAASLERFAAAGGTVVLTNRTGVKNLNNVCHLQPLPGPLAKCAGVRVAEYDPVGRDKHAVRTNGGNTYSCDQWCDVLEPIIATPFATYADDFFAGRPAATRNAVGSGEVYYVGVNAEDAFYAELFVGVLGRQRIAAIPGVPDGVQAALRHKENRAFLFLLNLCREPREVRLGRPSRSLLSGQALPDVIDLKPYDVEIVEWPG